MTPGPTLQDLIEITQTDSQGSGSLDLLAQASLMAVEMEQLGDALIGHFVDQCRRAGNTWAEISGSLGVTRQAVHKRYSLGEPSFERFTDRCRRVLASARQVAKDRHEGFVGTEHLLLALFGPDEADKAFAASTLREAGFTRQACEAILNSDRAPNLESPIPATVPFTPRATNVLRRAVEEALAMGHNYIGTEHVLLAVFQESEGLAVRLLEAMGVDEAEIRSRLVAKLDAYAKAKVGQLSTT